MSHQASTLVTSRQVGSPNLKSVLMHLANYCDEEWSCFPSQATLAWETELGERTVRRCLAMLEVAGLIHRERRNDGDGHRTSDRIYLVSSAIESLPAKTAVRQPLPATQTGLPANDDSPTGQSLAGYPLEDPSENTLALGVQPASSRADDPFGVFYADYPVKKGRRAAERAWHAALKRATAAEIMAGLELARSHWETNGTPPKFIPHPTTWLNQDRWADAYETLGGDYDVPDGVGA